MQLWCYWGRCSCGGELGRGGGRGKGIEVVLGELVGVIGRVEKSVVAEAIKKFDIDTEKTNPLYA